MDFELLSSLWLHEPDQATLQQANTALGLPLADPVELASAYTDLFLLNVYPYSTVFTSLDGELNAAGARRIAALYDSHTYRPDELRQVAAPDHVGLCLGFMATRDDILPYLLDWIPVCCLAVERDPAAHLFYRTLAALTRETLLTESSRHPIPDSQLPTPDSQLSTPSSELTLHDLVRFFLAPARCGMFLSRSAIGQLANAIGLRLPFGSRVDVATMLFEAAGENDRVAELIGRLEAEAAGWAAAYQQWSIRYPVWRPAADRWLDLLEGARRTLTLLRAVVENPPELEAHEIADLHGLL